MKGIIANNLNAEKQVKTKGLFDWCVLEAVINSVVDDEFEKAVLTACNATLSKYFSSSSMKLSRVWNFCLNTIPFVTPSV